MLLILAGITIQVVLQGGIIRQANNAGEQYKIEQARDKLSVTLSNAQIQKVTNSEYNQNNYLDELILKEVLNSKVMGDVAIVDGYAFTLDRSVPKIGKYVGKETELVFPELKTNVTIAADRKTATITITAKEEKDGIKKIEVLQEGIVIKTYTYENRKDEIQETCTVSRNGKYVIKATAALTANKIEEITSLVSSIEYSPNGNKTWKKEHQVKVFSKENIDKVKSIKYQWTTTDIEAEPAVNTFTNTIESGGTITENTLTGRYYLWTLLEDNDGSTRIEKSEEFWFDNTNPTAELATEWVEEDGQNRLKISVSNVIDEHSGINNNVVKLYVTPENGTKEEKNITLTNGTGEIIVNGLNMESLTIIEVSVSDNAGNVFNFNKKVGRIYLIKNGKILGDVSTSGQGSHLTEKDNGTVLLSANSASNSAGCGWSGIEFDWAGGKGEFCGNITRRGSPQYGICKLTVFEKSRLYPSANCEDWAIAFNNKNLVELPSGKVMNFCIPFECRSRSIVYRSKIF